MQTFEIVVAAKWVNIERGNPSLRGTVSAWSISHARAKRADEWLLAKAFNLGQVVRIRFTYQGEVRAGRAYVNGFTAKPRALEYGFVGAGPLRRSPR